MTVPKRYDIYLIRWQLRKSNDFRPCIVLDLGDGRVDCVMLISSSDLYRSNYDFLIRSDHPDFGATGLKKTSFAIGDQIHEIPASLLTVRLGHLEGELCRAFEKWLG
jgi:mRNA-degrading endonuclease toxin of MazEF toxin-antitoxin module